jgi:type IX secretion system PorP/SprF family membrane protein
MKNFLIALLLTFSVSAIAQQEAQYSQYMFNSLVINPAYAGYREQLNVTMFHRDQWTGLQGAPKTQSLAIDGAFGNDEKVGLGLTVVNDKIGLQRKTSAAVNYAYRLPVGANDSRLAFGLSLGMAQFMLNSADAVIDDPTDPNFASRQTYFLPDARFGVHFSTERFYAGISATNLITRSERFLDAGNNTVAKQGQHFFLTAGYLIDLNENFKLKPSFLVKEDTKAPASVDLNSFLLIRNAVWLGASYRTGVNLWKKNNLNAGNFKQNSVVGVVEALLLDKFRVGYGYDYALTELGSYTNGTHEISVSLILNGNRKSSAMLTPRYF